MNIYVLQCKILALVVSVGLLSAPTFAQSIKELNQRQSKIQEEIEMISGLIEQTTGSILSQQEKYNLLVKRRDVRKKLIQSLNAEVAVVDAQIKDKEGKIAAMEREVDKIKTEYGQLARQIYQWEKTSSPYIYLFSAQSINQALRRYFYIKQFEESRKEKREEFQRLITDVEDERSRLEQTKKNKQRVADQKASENKKVQADINSMKETLDQLRSRETDLKADLVEQERAMRELEIIISKVISREAERKETSAEGLADTPEAKSLAQAFEANKGKLPWPVKKGFIGKRFGKQAHATLKNLEINNNGIDIITEKHADVYAIFEGEVIGVVMVPGYQRMVILRHGSYYSVYSHLEATYVDKGMKVSTGAALGTVFHDKKTEQSQVHLEIWRGKDKLNPAIWLLKN